MNTAKEMTRAEMVAEIALLKEQMSKMPKALSFKKTEKGGLSVYGLGRFPVTLYRSQWEKLLGVTDTIKEMIQDLPLQA